MALGRGMVLDAETLSRLYAEHAESLLGFFMRRVFDPEAAMDLVAETFAAAFADRRRFRGGDDRDALAWLFGIARHRALNHSRRAGRERRALRRLGFERRPLTSEEYERIEQLAGFGDVRDELAHALSKLGGQQQDALRLRIIEERPYAEVAAELGVTEQTARARVSRALAVLRETPALRTLIERHESTV
jgi:RNA polymerase sigma-70 factor (ECF subfamily)